MQSDPAAERSTNGGSAPLLPEPTGKRLLRNSVTQAAAKVITVASTFAVLGILARSLSPVEYGAWGIAFSAYQIIMSLDMGIGAVLLNRTARLILRGQEDEARDHVFSAAIALFLFAAALAAVFFLWPGFLDVLGVPRRGTIGAAVRLAMIGGSFYLMPGVLLLLFHVWLEAGVVALNDCVRSILLVLSTAIVAWLGGRIVPQVAAYYGIYVVTGLAWSFYLLRQRQWSLLAYTCHEKRVRRFLQQTKSMLAEGSSFAFLNAAAIISANADAIIVAHVASVEAVGPYVTLQRLYVGLINLNMTFFFSYWSAFTIKYEQRDFIWLRRVLRLTTGAALAVGVGFLLTMLLAGPTLLKLWAGISVPDQGLYISFGIWATVSMIVTNLSTFLKGTGHVKRQVVWTILSVVLNIPLGFWLGHRYGLTGVNAATTIATGILLINNLLEVRRVLWSKAG